MTTKVVGRNSAHNFEPLRDAVLMA